MNPPRIRVVDMEGLTELLDEMFKKEPVSDEVIQHRFEHACRLAYRIARYLLKNDQILAGSLLKTACDRMESEKSMDGAAGAMIMEATSEYLDLKQEQNRELFMKEFILAMDRAVKFTRRSIEEQYDTRTEQSASQRPTQPPTTP